MHRSRTKATLKHYCHYLLILLITYVLTAIPALGASIIAFGDSITYGTGSKTGGYPPRLQQIIEQSGKPCTIYNQGVPSERTYQGIERIDEVLNTIPADAILIMEGTNDIRSRFPIQTTRLNLQLMIDKAKAKGVEPILATLTPSNQAHSEVLIPKLYNPMIRKLAKDNNITLVDQFTAIEKKWQALTLDGIHPNDDGYLYLAKTWNKTVGEMISSTGNFTGPKNLSLWLVLVFLVLLVILFTAIGKKVKNRMFSPPLLKHIGRYR
jgi:lysophospholipase L1-like esterase